MRVTTWAEYGLIVSLHLAKDGGDAPIPARDLAERAVQRVRGMASAAERPAP